jgi:excisionase family DNA binding protein
MSAENHDFRLVLTIPETARLLRISRGLAYEMARRGELPIIRLHRRLLVPRVALERMLAECNGSRFVADEGSRNLELESRQLAKRRRA